MLFDHTSDYLLGGFYRDMPLQGIFCAILPRSFPFEVDNGNPTKNGSL
jgi:hypothetical protein